MSFVAKFYFFLEDHTYFVISVGFVILCASVVFYLSRKQRISTFKLRTKLKIAQNPKICVESDINYVELFAAISKDLKQTLSELADCKCLFRSCAASDPLFANVPNAFAAEITPSAASSLVSSQDLAQCDFQSRTEVCVVCSVCSHEIPLLQSDVKPCVCHPATPKSVQKVQRIFAELNRVLVDSFALINWFLKCKHSDHRPSARRSTLFQFVDDCLLIDAYIFASIEGRKLLVFGDLLFQTPALVCAFDEIVQQNASQLLLIDLACVGKVLQAKIGNEFDLCKTAADCVMCVHREILHAHQLASSEGLVQLNALWWQLSSAYLKNAAFQIFCRTLVEFAALVGVIARWNREQSSKVVSVGKNAKNASIVCFACQKSVEESTENVSCMLQCACKQLTAHKECLFAAFLHESECFEGRCQCPDPFEMQRILGEEGVASKLLPFLANETLLLLLLAYERNESFAEYASKIERHAFVSRFEKLQTLLWDFFSLFVESNASTEVQSLGNGLRSFLFETSSRLIEAYVDCIQDHASNHVFPRGGSIFGLESLQLVPKCVVESVAKLGDRRFKAQDMYAVFDATLFLTIPECFEWLMKRTSQKTAANTPKR